MDSTKDIKEKKKNITELLKPFIVNTPTVVSDNKEVLV